MKFREAVTPEAPNWRPFIMGVIETLCLAAIGIASLPEEVWDHPRNIIIGCTLIIAKTVKDFVTKDKEVTGTSQTRSSSGALGGGGYSNNAGVGGLRKP